MSRPLAVAVAEVLETCAWDRIPERALPLLAKLVTAAQEASDCIYEEHGRNVPSSNVDAALRDVAAALGVTE